MLAVLNERPSPAVVATLESLFQGPDPFDQGRRLDGLPKLEPWDQLVAFTNMKPVGSMHNYTKGAKESIRFRQRIVRLGLERNPANWNKLRDLYLESISQLGQKKLTAAIAQAMAAGDHVKTPVFLLSQLDLDYGKKEQTVAAIASLGAIADPASLAPLQAFIKKGERTHFHRHPFYQPYIDYSLHRCRGSQRWKLVKEPGGCYSIRK